MSRDFAGLGGLCGAVIVPGVRNLCAAGGGRCATVARPVGVKAGSLGPLTAGTEPALCRGASRGRHLGVPDTADLTEPPRVRVVRKPEQSGVRTMKRIVRMMMVTGLAAGLLGGAAPAMAQDRGPQNFDPEQFRQRMMERVREELEITNDSEWQAIEPLVNRVFEARRDLMGGRGFVAGPRRGGGPGGQGQQGGPGRGPAFGQPSPELEALNRAIESKASASELKAALAKYREARKAREEALRKAQEDLRKVLTVRQEAIAVANGWLD